MKKIIFASCAVIVLVAIAAGAYYFFGTKSKYGEAPPKKDLTGVIVEPVTYSMKGKTFMVPDIENVSVTLDLVAPSAKRDYPMGRYDAGDGISRGSLVALDDFTTENINGLRAVPIAMNHGGSGDFMYLAIMTDDGTNLQHATSVPLGDRIKIKSVRNEGSIVSVNYLVHDRGQAMAELPTVDTTAIIDIATVQVVQAGRVPQSEAYIASKSFAGKYTWIETVYENGEVMQPSIPEVYTLTFNANQIQLGTDCNSGSANFSATTGSTTTFTVDVIASTKMFCEASEENEYFKMVSQIKTYREEEGGNLIFVLDGGEAEMFFSPVKSKLEYDSLQSYRIDSVVSVSTESVDPLPEATDDEYTLYTITLKDGSIHEVKVFGMMERTSVERLFTETGFVGDVATLMTFGE